MTDWIARLPQISELLARADHVDVKTADSTVSLREFVAAMMAYEPGWMRFLFGLRKRLVRLIGLRQEGMPTAPHWTPEEVPMQPGQRASFFTVRKAVDGEVWAWWLNVSVTASSPSCTTSTGPGGSTSTSFDRFTTSS
jgi:hypothetical protein